MNHRGIAFLTILLVLSFSSTPAGALWHQGGNLICDEVSTQRYIQSAPDGAGNIYLVWEDYRSGSGPDIYAQMIDNRGNELWTSGGIAIATGTPNQWEPLITGDGAGGAIIVWEDFETGPVYGIKAQKIDADGTPQWTAGGVTLLSGSSGYTDLKLISDLTGGVIVAWYSSVSGNYDIYAQRADSDGTVMWGASGTSPCTETSIQQQPELCPDGTGGAIIAWMDSRNGNLDVYARRIGPSGSIYWTSNGVPICTQTASQSVNSVVGDGGGGAIIIWQDLRNGTSDIFAQRVSSGGVAQWSSNGLPVCLASGNQNNPGGVSDGSGGAVIAWSDDRTTNTDIYAQRIDPDGTGLWTSDGVAVCTERHMQTGPKLIISENGNIIIGWTDCRLIEYTHYAQMLDLSGSAHWATNGVHAGHATYRTSAFDMSPDGEGGVIFSWDSYYSSTYDLMAQRVERNGYWGYPSPVIADIRDIPGDQGGSVDLAWYASRLDPWPAMAISHYTVWRAISHPDAILLASRGATIIESISEIAPQKDRDFSAEELSRSTSLPSPPDIIRSEMAGSTTIFWKMISMIDAYYLDSYSEVAATLFDSTSASDENHYFQVIAHSGVPSEFWISETDSGYSVDNLAPVVPLGLAGEQSYSPEGIVLTWDPNTETDLSGYRIYRGLTDDFEPGPGNLVASIPDTVYMDDGWSWEDEWFYKLAAVDIHGNESGYALLAPSGITGEDIPDAPLATFLAQNYPNPFNPTTTIRFGLKKAGHVSLRVYDAAGRLVREMIDREMPAGDHAEPWDGLADDGSVAASGMYFYRLVTSSFAETRKMVMLR